MKLLLAEDTRDLSRALCAVLTHEGYDVDPVYDGEEASEHIAQDSYDVIILDIMMPKKNGIQVLKDLRAMNIVTPVLMLTARTEVDDRVTGLDAGADDYLTKPFAMKELLARIRALAKRRSQYFAASLSYGDLSLSPESFELKCENSVRLSIKEFELMEALISEAGRPLSTRQILDRVWPSESDAQEDTVWLYISYLKRKLKSIDSRVLLLGKRGGDFYLQF